MANILDRNLLFGFRSGQVSVYGELDVYQKPESSLQDEALLSLLEIEGFKPGQYLVHKTHGIGRYVDIVSRQSGGYKKDYFLIEYANNDRLYVPTWQADRITKYIGKENPRITTLNSKQWDRMKTRVRNSVKKLAFDLSRLYAHREAMEGFSFTVDTPWQREISDLFPFTETIDQVKAIQKVNQAMASSRPMDMLVCGDVGFGKTEVAIRAAFTAIESGKQVMMLVPTTILADQHYHNFSQRYQDYPVKLEVLSRFRKRSSQKEIIKSFNQGQVDMIIGTHRILQKDINPKNLGLIIVDEEQRFGVGSKEKIKLLKRNADVLTLTATPIPRTLYMALTGIRDMATINTHPEGRNPIETFVGQKDDQIIRQAVDREINRGGQVYYVFNNIKGILNRLSYLNNLVPEARIALTHGQMKGTKIEQIMSDFIDKKYDVLLTTTIIESGMDISNVNTLIVEKSHSFGLSQLHQLRGRVGRSTERAYAYFFYPRLQSLSLTSLRRLKALAEYTDLGSGYSIALRDMEIRGAGELLGLAERPYG
ncbi:MAG: CarD family transcriptional regulator [Actinomycetota bacterium]|nr:CarD family transcriptional regulator [Actinomycetota bacterium]